MVRASSQSSKGWSLLYLILCCLGLAQGAIAVQQHPMLSSSTSTIISNALFASLERMSRLVDVAYCVGNTGISKPFNCISRCREFPSLYLINTWNTGILLSDSCGYVAVDHGSRRSGDSVIDISDKAIIVAFRGTYSLTNTVIDLSTVPQAYIPYPSLDDGGRQEPHRPEHECHNCTVHMGFLGSWRNARELVLPELKIMKELYPSYPIHLVGHSLGGAVACLAALELKVSLGWDGITVTTFGEPRLGNYHLARYVDRIFGLDTSPEPTSGWAYRRVTHNDDPVPLLPLSEWGYESHAGEIYITKENLPPAQGDVMFCTGDNDAHCSAGSEPISDGAQLEALHKDTTASVEGFGIPTRLKLWQLFFAHRDYFWRLGLCVPGGDPADWGRDKYDFNVPLGSGEL